MGGLGRSALLSAVPGGGGGGGGKDALMADADLRADVWRRCASVRFSACVRGWCVPGRDVPFCNGSQNPTGPSSCP